MTRASLPEEGATARSVVLLLNPTRGVLRLLLFNEGSWDYRLLVVDDPDGN